MSRCCPVPGSSHLSATRPISSTPTKRKHPPRNCITPRLDRRRIGAEACLVMELPRSSPHWTNQKVGRAATPERLKCTSPQTIWDNGSYGYALAVTMLRTRDTEVVSPYGLLWLTNLRSGLQQLFKQRAQMHLRLRYRIIPVLTTLSACNPSQRRLELRVNHISSLAPCLLISPHLKRET